MAVSELENVVPSGPSDPDRSCQRTSHLHFFLGFSSLWLVVLVALLKFDPNPWVIAPLGLGLSALSLLAWAIHRNVSPELNAETGSRSRGKNSGNTPREGFGGLYLTIGLTSLYLGCLSLFHGNLPGWPIPAKPAEPIVAAEKSPSGPPSAPSYNQRPTGSYPGPNYPGQTFLPSMTPPPGAYPRQGVTYPQNGLPLRPAGMTPPPRPFGTPPIGRTLPPNFPPGTVAGSSNAPSQSSLPPAAGSVGSPASTANQPSGVSGQPPLPSQPANTPTGSSNPAAPAPAGPTGVPLPIVPSSPAPFGPLAKPLSAHPSPAMRTR